ncbi:MAG TPA: glycosyltransferase [Thermoanaerobaculia bacterium]|nr:glycosyltransferase [Thermoanaerobaculia bacterium]
MSRGEASPAAAEPQPFAPPSSHRRRLERSRRQLLAAIGGAAGFTYVRGVGNRGDELIQAGTRRLLAGLDYREIGFEEVAGASGELAVISGGGAWCRVYHEIMPRVLALAEMRFARVVILPSSFEPAEEAVRDALSRSRALVFARERESWRQIRGLCDARLAHDCAFFFDFTPFARAGDGVLHAYRTDRESSSSFALPPDNVDISDVCEALPEWLARIAGAALVRTDRAHVMIAAALLGKAVQYRASAYHKLPAIAEFALADFEVSAAPPEREVRRPGVREAAPAAGAALEEGSLDALRRELVAHAEANLAPLPASLLAGGGEPRVTVVMLSWNRASHTEAALAALRRFARLPCHLLVIDNNSPAAARDAVRRSCRAHGAELVELDRNLGCAGGRQLGVERATTEYVLFIDNDIEVLPGTLEHLAQVLDSDSAAIACGGTIVLPDGRVQLCGGDYREDGAVLTLAPLGRGLRFDDPGLGSSGPCRWVSGALLLARWSAFATLPLEVEMAYFEDNEWCYRLDAWRPGSLRRSVEALALHQQQEKGRLGCGLVGVGDALPFLAAAARFHQLHGRVLDTVFAFAPELASGGRQDVAAARLLLELIAAKGTDWALLNWLNGGLAPLLRAGVGPEAELAAAEERLRQAGRELAATGAELAAAEERLRQARRELAAIHDSRWWRGAHAYWSARRALGAALSRLPGRSR